jgi:hypothetical protein
VGCPEDGGSSFVFTLVHFHRVSLRFELSVGTETNARPLCYILFGHVPVLEAGVYSFFLKSRHNCEVYSGTRCIRSGHKGHCSRGLHYAPRDHVLYSLSISLSCGFFISSSVSSLSDYLLFMWPLVAEHKNSCAWTFHIQLLVLNL